MQTVQLNFLFIPFRLTYTAWFWFTIMSTIGYVCSYTMASTRPAGVTSKSKLTLLHLSAFVFQCIQRAMQVLKLPTVGH